MNESKQTIESTQQETARPGDSHEDGSHLTDQIIQAIESDRELVPVDHSAAQREGSLADSLHQISQDVDQFARGWIRRVRKLLQRSSQLVERETMLAGAIAKLNQQQSDWNRRTADKDAEIKEHSTRLTEAWLEVEAARRKAIQGARAAATSGKVPPRHGVVGGPIVPVQADGGAVHAAAIPSVVPDVETDHASSESSVGTPADQSPQPTFPQAVVPVPVTPAASGPAAPPPVNVPIAPQSGMPSAVPLGPPATLPRPSQSNHPLQNAQVCPAPVTARMTISSIAGERSMDPEQAQQSAHAAKQKKIEEFQRMQRALRSNQNK